MKSLIITDYNSSINVEYVTDLINSNANNFTVMAIKNFNTSYEYKNFNFQALPYNLPAFINFCQTYYMQLVLVDYQAATSQTLVALPNISGGLSGGPLGLDNI